jgi:CRP/FNR family cyclic AMP-dependent transcriptional regulator
MDVLPSGPANAAAHAPAGEPPAPVFAAPPAGTAEPAAPTAIAASVLARREQLAKIHVFANLRSEALDLVAHVVGEESHLRGTVIFRQGDAGEKLYLILDGTVRLTHASNKAGASARGHEPHEEVVATLGAGDVFGELALFDDAPRAANARVEDATRMLAIHRDAFEDLLFIHKDLAFEVQANMVRLLCARLRDVDDGATPLVVGAPAQAAK